MKKWYVVCTGSYLPVYSSDKKVDCNRYLRNALSMGSPPGYLSIVSARQLSAYYALCVSLETDGGRVVL